MEREEIFEVLKHLSWDPVAGRDWYIYVGMGFFITELDKEYY